VGETVVGGGQLPSSLAFAPVTVAVQKGGVAEVLRVFATHGGHLVSVTDLMRLVTTRFLFGAQVYPIFCKAKKCRCLLLIRIHRMMVSKQFQ
jgi:hypothetical protein